MMKGKDFVLILLLTLFSNNIIFPVDNINTWEKIKKEKEKLEKLENVPIDNIYIQTYKNKNGIWKKTAYGTDLKSFVEPYGATEEDVVQINELPLHTRMIYNSQWIFIPYSEKYLKDLEKSGIGRITWQSAREDFIWPVEGIRITSRLGKRWGKFHPGLDIATPIGTVVLAAMDGEVKESKYLGDYGNTVVIGHNEFYVSIYAHLSEIFVKKGDKIKKGQVLGLSGTTGRSTGPHLHFEVRYLNVVLNPEVFLPAFKESIYAFAEKEAKENEEVENQ